MDGRTRQKHSMTSHRDDPQPGDVRVTVTTALILLAILALMALI